MGGLQYYHSKVIRIVDLRNKQLNGDRERISFSVECSGHEVRSERSPQTQTLPRS